MLHLIAKSSASMEVMFDHMIDSLNNRIIVDMNMSNQDGHLIFDTHVWYYNSCFWISQCLEYEFIKFANVHFSAFFVFLIWRMKWEMTRKYIN